MLSPQVWVTAIGTSLLGACLYKRNMVSMSATSSANVNCYRLFSLKFFLITCIHFLCLERGPSGQRTSGGSPFSFYHVNSRGHTRVMGLGHILPTGHCCHPWLSSLWQDSKVRGPPCPRNILPFYPDSVSHLPLHYYSHLTQGHFTILPTPWSQTLRG